MDGVEDVDCLFDRCDIGYDEAAASGIVADCHPAWIFLEEMEQFSEHRRLVICAVCLVDEIYEHAAVLECDLFDAELACEPAKPRNPQQFSCLWRYFPEPVLQARFELLQVEFAVNVVEFLIE